MRRQKEYLLPACPAPRTGRSDANAGRQYFLGGDINLNEASILVVDDEPILREIYAIWLQAAGCREVHTAVDGEDALAQLRKLHVDLLISDIRMPRMDGVTLVRRLCEIETPIPSIVFVSGFGQVDQREMYDLGVEAFAAKPLAREEMMEMIEKVLASREILWLQPMDQFPQQKLEVRADGIAGAEPRPGYIHLGRGGFSAPFRDQISVGRIAFSCSAMMEDRQLVGQGLVRWSSSADLRIGIEFVYLEESSRGWVVETLAAIRPRSFIPHL